MTIENRIIFDYNDLKQYFLKKFELLEESIIKERTLDYQLYNGDSNTIDASFAKISHFIKPDMIINIYAYFEFWREELFKLSGNKLKKKKNETLIHALQNYMIKLNLNNDLFDEYCNNLEQLNGIRNIYIHRGGHPNDNEMIGLRENGLLAPNDIIILNKEQILEWLENTKNCLLILASLLLRARDVRQ